MSSIRKAGVTFYPGVGVSPDSTGLASTITLKYKKRGNIVFTDAGITFVEENAGTYTAPLTLNTVGDYIIIIESTDSTIENLEGNVLVTAASIDDVSNAVDALQLDMTSIKSQIDLLDEDSMNTLEGKLDGLTTTLDNVKLLVDDANGDTTGLNSIMDFVTEINNALQGGGSSLEVLSGFADNLELMLEGKGYTDTAGIVVLEADSYGLQEIYNKIETSGGDTVYIRGRIDEVNLTITNLGDTINNWIAGATGMFNDIEAKIDAVKVVVDSNTATLTDAGYGLGALKTILDGLTTDVSAISTDNSDVLAVLNDGTNGIIALRDTLITKLDLMDAKLDNVSSATRSRIFV